MLQEFPAPAAIQGSHLFTLACECPLRRFQTPSVPSFTIRERYFSEIGRQANLDRRISLEKVQLGLSVFQIPALKVNWRFPCTQAGEAFGNCCPRSSDTLYH